MRRNNDMKRLTAISIVLFCLLYISGSANADSYLIAPSEEDNASFRSAVSAFLGGATVDYFDARSGTLSVASLANYDAVFTWANFAYSDRVAFGDNLADYVDAGGRVVIGAFTTYTLGNYLSGDIMGAGYSPVTSPTGSNHFFTSSYAGDGTPLLWSGVSSYSATYRDYVILQGAGILDGTFADGEIAGAYRPDLGVIYLGGMETIGGTGGDAARLLANAFGASQAAPVPEPASVLLLGSGLAIIGLGARQKRN
jgi:hypothetical protein